MQAPQGVKGTPRIGQAAVASIRPAAPVVERVAVNVQLDPFLSVTALAAYSGLYSCRPCAVALASACGVIA